MSNQAPVVDLEKMDRFGGFTNPFEQKGRFRKIRRIPIYLLTVIMLAPRSEEHTSELQSH